MKRVLPKSLQALFKRTGIIRARDLAPLGIPRYRLAEMVAQGILYRSGRGLYSLASKSVSEHHSLAEASKRVPHGVD